MMKILNVGDRVMNTWVYARSDDAVVMVDTGYAGRMARVERRLRRHGVAPESVRTIFLTHAHDDHAGFLNEWLATYPETQVVASEKALAVLLCGQNAFDGGCSGGLAWLFCQLMRLAGKGAHCFPALEWRFLDRFVVVTAQEKTAAEALLGGRILETPGHTADSLSLQVGQAMFCGDAAMNGLPSRHRVTIWISEVAAFSRSWQRLLASGAEMLYPGHGKPFATAELARFLPHLAKVRLYALHE